MTVEPGILDANILAYAFNVDAPHHPTMLANGVNRIYTYNSDDFEVFSELAVVEP
jgi:hypothetical protein